MSKGLTLIEMMAVLIILAALTLLIVPNINERIKSAREVQYETQLEEIKSAGISYFANNLTYTNEYEYVFLGELIEGGYLDRPYNKLYDREFSDLTLVIKSREQIEGDFNNNPSIDIDYYVMDTSYNYMKFLAERWYKKNKSSIDLSSVTSVKSLVKSLTFSDLESLAYVGTTEYPIIVDNKLVEISGVDELKLSDSFTIGIYAELVDDSEIVITYE